MQKYLSNMARYSIHLKHLKHILMQKTSPAAAHMTASLQEGRRAKKGRAAELSFLSDAVSYARAAVMMAME